MNLLDAIKLANEAADKLRDAKLNEALAAVKMEAVGLAEEVVRLRNENLDLRESARLREALTFDGIAYWMKVGEGREPAGPFCQPCRDGDGKLSHLRDEHPNYWKCHVCGKLTYKPGARERERADARAAQPRLRDGDIPWEP